MVHEPLFGRWLRKRRKALDLTQKELARRVGCSPATIRKIEAEERRPSKDLALRLAPLLGLATDEHHAFVGFARRGWLDGSLGVNPTSGEGLPWHAASTGSSPPAGTRGPPHLDDLAPENAPLFVARERELGNLDHYLATALEGHARVVFVKGEPGSGKTALMAEFARRSQVAHPSLLCATGTCHAFTGGGDPYLPFRDLLEMLCGDVERRRFAGSGGAVHARRLWDASPTALEALFENGPELVGVFVSRLALARPENVRSGGGRSVPEEPPARRDRSSDAVPGFSQSQLLEQYASVLRRIAEAHPLLLLVDDLQWADGASIDLLFHLSRRLEGSSVLVVGAYRPHEVALPRPHDGANVRHPLAPVLSELARRFADIEVDLDRIPAEENRALVDALVDHEPNTLGESFRAALFARTEGHPLFAVELLHALQARGDLTPDLHGRWGEGATLDWQTLPARVDALIAQRVDGLDDPLRESLRAASVEGEEFTAQVIARVLDIDELRLLGDLSQELERRHGLVRELDEAGSGAARPSRYRFAHALFQQHLYQSLGAGERRLLHGRVARVLAEIHRDDPDEVAAQLAHHHARAGEEPQELHYLVRAGVRAQRLAAMDDAAGMYRAALARWPRTDRAGLAQIQRRLAECLWVTGQLREALRFTEASREIYRSLGDRIATGALERQVGRLHWELGDRTQALTHYHEALATLELAPASVDLARAVSSISQMHMLAGDYEPALVWGERALTLAEELGAEDVKVHALSNVGVSHTYLHEQEAGLVMLREAARKGAALGLPHDTGRAYHCLCEALICLCRYDEARTSLEDMASYADRHHVAMFRDTSRLMQVELDWQQGRWADALTRLGELTLAWSLGLPQGIVALLASTCRARIANDLGQPRAALDELEGNVAAARSTEEQQIIAPFAGQLFRAYAALGMEMHAVEAIREVHRWAEAAASVEPYGTVLPLLVACRWLAARGSPDAPDCLGLLERIDRQLGTQETRAVLAEARGAISVSETVARERIAPLQTAVVAWRELARPYDLLRALVSLGEQQLGAKNATAAREALDRAGGIVDELAEQLEDVKIKAAFLGSDLVRSCRSLWSSLGR